MFCFRGYKSHCKVKFETKCYNQKIYRELTEDYPECRTEKVRKCDDSRSRVTPRCQTVEVNRCKIAQRTVRKAIPQTKCARVPVKMCTKVPCPKTAQKCYKVTQLHHLTLLSY